MPGRKANVFPKFTVHVPGKGICGSKMFHVKHFEKSGASSAGKNVSRETFSKMLWHRLTTLPAKSKMSKGRGAGAIVPTQYVG
jgi:hypothetical protein